MLNPTFLVCTLKREGWRLAILLVMLSTLLTGCAPLE